MVLPGGIALLLHIGGNRMRRILVFTAALFLTSAALAQQSYPNRPLRMVIPWPPGQATDLVGRVIAQKLTEILGYQVVADNRAGAGGTIGTDIVAKAAPDGYTLLAASSGPVTISPLLLKTPYVVERDLAPVANAGFSPFLLATQASFPASSAREFIALIKANPGKYNFASSGTGASAHLIAEYFNSAAGIKATHVPYKGSVPALTDVISGQIAYVLETVAATMPHVRGGRLKAYGVSVAKGSVLAPGIPPLATAADLPGFDAAAWLGVMVSAGTPKPLVDKLSAAVDKALQSQEVRDKIMSVGVEVDYRRIDEMGRYLKDQSDRFADIIKKNGIRIE
jgi:tripartite-type tricarboxylate transporter receptor subunit TctC